MEITALGYLIFPLGLLLFIFNRNLLYYLFIFFTPFSGSSVLNIESIQFGLQPSFLLGALCIIGLIFDLIRRPFKIVRILKTQRFFVIALWLFWFIALVSLVSSIILFFWFGFEYKTFNPGVLEDLGVRKFKLTAFAYLTFFLLIPLLTLIKVDTREKLLNCLYALFYSGLFTVLWGIATQEIGFFLQLEYPSWLFNNHIGYIQFAAVPLYGIPRLNSVAAEPSHQAFFLIIYLSIFITLAANKVYLISRRFFQFSLLIVLLGIVLTTSTTAYVTMGFGVMLMAAHLVVRKFVIKRHLLYLILLIGLGIFIIGVISVLVVSNFNLPLENFSRFISENTIGKLQSGSGHIRTSAIPLTLEVFAQNPIIGTGWSRNRSFDLGTTLLANVGVLGFLAFLLMMLVPLISVLRIHQKSKDITLSVIGLSFFYALVLALFASFIAVPDFLFLYFWVVLGLAASLLTIYKREHKKARIHYSGETRI